MKAIKQKKKAIWHDAAAAAAAVSERHTQETAQKTRIKEKTLQ
jgi:hypothetical protein